MLKSFRIRSKLAVALALPLAALVALAGFEAVSATSDAREVREQAETARAALGPGSLVISLQTERNLAGVTLLGLEGAVDLNADTNDEARAATDDSLAELQVEVADASTDVQSAFSPTFDALRELGAIRDDIDAYEGPQDLSAYEVASETFDTYSAVLGTVYDTTSRLATALDEADLRNGVEIIDAGARQSEASAQIVRWVLISQLTGQQDVPEVRRQVTEWVERSSTEEDAMFDRMVGDYARRGGSPRHRPGQRVHRRGQPVHRDRRGRCQRHAGGGQLDRRERSRDRLGARHRGPDPRRPGRQPCRRRDPAAVDLHRARRRDRGPRLARDLARQPLHHPTAALAEAQADEMATKRLPGAVKQILDTPPGEDVTLPEVEPIRSRPATR